MELQSCLQNAKTVMVKWIKRIVFVTVLGMVTLFCFSYWGTYSEGIRSGMIVKISKKGWVFKTYEGQLNLQTFGANKSQIEQK
jgi:hypothetical protein